MQFFETLFLIATFALLLSLCFWGRKRTYQIRSFQIGTLIFILHLIFEICRWQMALCFLVFLVCSLFLLRTKVSHGFFRILGFILGIFFIASSALYSLMMPIIPLPAPSGPYPVGTTKTVLTDTSRKEIHSEDTSDQRSLFLEVWYPSRKENSGKVEANSLWSTVYEGPLDRISIFLNYLKGIKTSSFPEAIVNKEEGPYPIVLFNHGFQLFTAQNTLLMEHLASYGYIMVSIGHPYESLRVNLPEKGGVIPFFLRSWDNFKEAISWIESSSKPILEAIDAIKQEENPQTRAEIILKAIKSSEMNDVVAYWKADNQFVFNELLSPKQLKHNFLSIADTSRIGVMGMSIGGATATEVAKSEARIKAAINMDGLQYGYGNRDSLNFPFMMLYSEDGAGLNEFLKLNSQNDYYEYTFKGAKHSDFSDMPIIWPIMKMYGQMGDIPPERMIDLTKNLVLNFWNAYLKDQNYEDIKQNQYPELDIYSHQIEEQIN